MKNQQCGGLHLAPDGRLLLIGTTNNADFRIHYGLSTNTMIAGTTGALDYTFPDNTTIPAPVPACWSLHLIPLMPVTEWILNPGSTRSIFLSDMAISLFYPTAIVAVRDRLRPRI
ncbi:MAG: hypothetical protein JXR25_11115 [Pontiellaceae bacterium]|nr:hypothetical protein [Pontiellaceae bacterium]MBN2785368.1 hypothetical protein [Pontiellaceae bacterium]